MKFADLVSISTGNLRRMKLRTFLTVSGVIIAIAAFVAMLSFGAGMQQNVARQFNELGLLHTIMVYPSNDENSDSTIVLNQAAIDQFSTLNGVLLAYPYDAVNLTIKFADSTLSAEAQSLSVAATQTKLFSKMTAGKMFSSDSADEVVIVEYFLEKLYLENPDSALGSNLIISKEQASLDSGLAYLAKGFFEDARQRWDHIKVDSLLKVDFLKALARDEAMLAAKSFFNGFLQAPDIITDTLVITGVIEGSEHGRSRLKPIIIPVGIASQMSRGGFSTDPTELFASLQAGNLFDLDARDSHKEFPRVTLNMDPYAPHKIVTDSIEALGYRAFSYAEEFEEIKKFFIYFDMGLAVIGLIALFTASLGIANTMIMSIIERRKEIGILKSLGADDRDIRILFLFESGIIGFIGAWLGIVFGWIISRVASLIVKKIMENEGVPSMDFFAVPLWLIGIAVVFGVTVAVLAGMYPARRAARIDPVEALRSE